MKQLYQGDLTSRSTEIIVVRSWLCNLMKKLSTNPTHSNLFVCVLLKTNVVYIWGVFNVKRLIILLERI